MRNKYTLLNLLLTVCLLGCGPEPTSQIPDFRAKSFQGDTLSLRALTESKVSFINIWSTFCGPCLKELPLLHRIHDRYKENGKVAFITIALNTENELNQFTKSADSTNPYRKVFRYSGLTHFELPVLIASKAGFSVMKGADQSLSAGLKDPGEMRAISTLFGLSGVPITVIYNREGQLIYKNPGVDMSSEGLLAYEAFLTGKIDSLLKSK